MDALCIIALGTLGPVVHAYARCYLLLALVGEMQAKWQEFGLCGLGPPAVAMTAKVRSTVAGEESSHFAFATGTDTACTFSNEAPCW
jgi:hypothetical protein